MGVGRGTPGDGRVRGAGQDVTSCQAVYQFRRAGGPTGPWRTPPARPIHDGPAVSFGAEGHPGYVEPATHSAGSSSSGVPRPGAAPAEQWQAPGPAAPALPPLPPAPTKATKATFVPPTFKAPPPLAPGPAALVAALCAASNQGAAPCAAAAARCAAAMGAAPGAAGGGGLSGAAACADGGGAAAGTLPAAAVGAAPAPPAATVDCARVTLKIIISH